MVFVCFIDRPLVGIKKIAVIDENRVRFFVKSRETKKITQTQNVFFQEEAASKAALAGTSLFKAAP